MSRVHRAKHIIFRQASGLLHVLFTYTSQTTQTYRLQAISRKTQNIVRPQRLFRSTNLNSFYLNNYPANSKKVSLPKDLAFIQFLCNFTCLPSRIFHDFLLQPETVFLQPASHISSTSFYVVAVMFCDAHQCIHIYKVPAWFILSQP